MSGTLIWQTAGAALFAGLAVLSLHLTEDANTDTQAGVIMELPGYIKGFVGEEQEISQAELIILPGDTEFARKVYRDARSDILCSIVLSGGERRSIHRPEACLPGQGWTVRGGEVVNIPLTDGRDLDVMKLSLVRQVAVGPGKTINVRSLYLYWFVGHDVMTPYHGRRVFLTSWDRVVRNINHRWAYVIVSATVTDNLRPNGLDEAQTLEMLKDFTAEIAPTFLK